MSHYWRCCLALLSDRRQGQYYFYKDTEMKTVSLVLAGLTSTALLPRQLSKATAPQATFSRRRSAHRLHGR